MVLAGITFGEQKYEYEPADVLPGAVQFVREETYWVGYGPGDEDARALVGYVLLTDDLVEIPGYSGHTLNTLVGMDGGGKITGIKIVQHSEPIVLIGLSEKVIHDFVAQYIGKDIRDRIIISDQAREGHIAVDAISGATVTAVAENATILEAGRRVGRTVGIVQAFEVRTRRVADGFTPATWDELVAGETIGRLIVQPQQLQSEGTGPVLDLRFTLLDAPTIGKNLLGERYYAIVQDRLAREGGSALFIGAEGSLSFKGAGFARGGIFDRFSLEQGEGLFVFKDLDYINYTALPIEGAPAFGEGGIFFVTDPAFDPAVPFTFHLTVPYRVSDERAYRTFLAEYQLPAELVVEDVPFWVTRWQENALTIVAFGLFLSAAALMFIFRQRLVPYRKVLHRTIGVIAVVWVGIVLKAQPSNTQILTLFTSAVHFAFPFEIFLVEPLIFLFWIAIVISMVFWARGFFCGWLCPYGALLEILIPIWQRVCPERLRHRIDAWDPGPVWRSGKYVTFLGILAVAFVNLPAAEMLNEVEPFKTFILRLMRPSAFIVYFVAITLVSTVSYRFFCRFLCPLGGALALPGWKPLAPLQRYEQCSSCKICYKGCEPKAISHATGIIDYRECLQCWDCQATGQDAAVCPELILAKREDRAPRLLVGALLLTGLLVPASSGAKTWTVTPPPDAAGAATASPVHMIGEAIAASAAGDTIHVRPGVYAEHVVVTKRLTIRGDEGAILDAGGVGHVLVVAASDVRVEGLTLRGCGDDIELSEAGIRIAQDAEGVEIVGNRIEQCRFGVWVHGSPEATIVGNAITGIRELDRNARGDCIHLWAARGADIRKNVLADCRDGVYMELSTDCRVTANTIRDSRYSVHTMWCDRSAYNDNVVTGNLVGLALMFSKQIEARGNTLYDNATHGILLTQVTRSEAIDNIVVGNSKGVFVYNSLYNTIRGNLVARNNLGLHYWGGAEENEIVDNSFIANEIQAKFVASHDQVWEGNFWSDYVGWDVDGNGRGDVPYHSNTLVDSLLWQYPLAKLLLASPAFQVLALAEREFPVITVPKGVDPLPWMAPPNREWESLLARYPATNQRYYGSLEKLPHIPGG